LLFAVAQKGNTVATVVPIVQTVHFRFGAHQFDFVGWEQAYMRSKQLQ
jgi:hypothetical protein